MTDYKTDNEQTMTDWWQSPLGQHVLMQEQSLLQLLSPHFHGYFQLQTGLKQSLLPQLSKPSIQKVMAPSADIYGDSSALPFKCHSIDTLLLPHVLEFSSDPHQVLREAERVLVSDGILVLCCFNPWSLWGLRRLFSWQDGPPWQGVFFSQTRIKDWLALLNFEVVTAKKYLFQPPLSSPKWLNKLSLMERWGQRLWPAFAGATILIATKRTIPLTPSPQRWRAQPLFPSGRLIGKPATREQINK